MSAVLKLITQIGTHAKTTLHRLDTTVTAKKKKKKIRHKESPTSLSTYR